MGQKGPLVGPGQTRPGSAYLYSALAPSHLHQVDFIGNSDGREGRVEEDKKWMRSPGLWVSVQGDRPGETQKL